MITSTEVEPNDYYAQHKYRIGKQIFIIMTTFVLNGNDIEKWGGAVIPICSVRVGNMVQDCDDESYHYPKMPYILMREKGTYYFKGVEFTESIIGMEKDPKISRLDATKNTIIPAIKENVVTKYDDGGRVNVCVVYKKTKQVYIRIRIT